MMVLSAITRSNSVFCPPPPGRPDPYAKDPAFPPRIPQSGQKGNTCTYYALQILRNEHRIGKNPSQSQLQQRQIEEIIFHHRKACSQVKFRLCHEELMQVHEQFFQKMRIPPDLIEKSVPKLLGKSWAEMSPLEQEFHARNVVFQQSYLAYGCSRSLWHPTQPIESLMEQLTIHGPHLVIGKIGKCYHQDAPSPDKKITGRSILLWKENSPRKELAENHAVVIVGAEIDRKKQQRVYFLDPLDGSDPKDVSTQKIYAIAYHELQTSIASLDGIHRKTRQSKKPVFSPLEPGENNYALYHHPAPKPASLHWRRLKLKADREESPQPAFATCGHNAPVFAEARGEILPL